MRVRTRTRTRATRTTGWAFALAMLALLLLLAWAPGCASREERFQSHLARAERFEAQGRLKEALIELRSALQLSPQSAEANFRIGEVLKKQGRLGDALFYFREAHRLDPDRVDAAMEVAGLVMGTDPDEAAKLIEAALQADPENPLVHLRRSELALVKADTKTALAEAKKAVELAPKEPRYRLQLGVVHQARIRALRLKKQKPPDEIFQAALEAFEAADRLAKGSLEARLQRARTLATWPHHGDQAEAAFRSLLELAQTKGDPGTVIGEADVALSFAQRQRRFELERIALEKILSADASAIGDPTRREKAEQRQVRAWRELAALAERDKAHGEELAKLLEKLRAQRDEDVSAHIGYARTLWSQGKRDEAVRHLEQTADRGIGTARALEEAVRLELSRGKLDAARALIGKLEERAPKSPFTKLAKARVTLAEGKAGEAQSQLRELAGTLASGDVQLLLAAAELATGDLEAARAAVDRALELSPEQPVPALRLRARILRRSGDWGPLLRTLRRLRRLRGRLDPSEQLMRVRALYGLGRERVARKLLEAMLDRPNPPVGAVLLFASQEGSRDPKAALARLEAALERFPTLPPLLRALASLELRSGHGDRALAPIERAIAKAPKKAGLRLLHARVLLALGRPADAEAEARAAFDADPSLPGALDLLVNIYAQGGKVDTARRELEEAAKAGRLAPEGRALLARLQLASGDDVAARNSLEAALAAKPDLPGAKNDLAYLLAEAGTDLDRALRLAQDAQRALGNDPRVADTLGYVYLKKGLYEAAARQLRYATELAEKSGARIAAPYFHLGMALHELGQESETVKALERALELAPDAPEAEQAKKLLAEARASLAKPKAARPES